MYIYTHVETQMNQNFREQVLSGQYLKYIFHIVIIIASTHVIPT